ncbi:MAG: hypothetical protein AB1411_09150 [Nitrospirota bacterium]
MADSRPETTGAERLIGRDRIVALLVRLLSHGKSALLVGPEGIGKTAVLQTVTARIQREPGMPRPVYCERVGALKELLAGIAEAIAQEAPGFRAKRPGALRLWTRGKLRRLVVPHLLTGRYALFLDHVVPVHGPVERFLESMVDMGRVPIIAAARSLDPGATGRLWWVGWHFERVEIAPLTPLQSRRLIEQTLDATGLALPDREAFVRELARRAEGNPRLITRLCRMAGSPKYRVGGGTSLDLLLLDNRIHALHASIEMARVEERSPRWN